MSRVWIASNRSCCQNGRYLFDVRRSFHRSELRWVLVHLRSIADVHRRFVLQKDRPIGSNAAVLPAVNDLLTDRSESVESSYSRGAALATDNASRSTMHRGIAIFVSSECTSFRTFSLHTLLACQFVYMRISLSFFASCSEKSDIRPKSLAGRCYLPSLDCTASSLLTVRSRRTKRANRLSRCLFYPPATN